MLKESFIIGALLGAMAGVIIYKNNNEVKKVIDKGEAMIKEKMEKCQSKVDKAIKKQG